MITLTETWYTLQADVYKPSGYQSFFLNRSHKIGGGLAILTKSGLNFELISEFSFITADIECLTLKFCDHVCSVIYQPPDSDLGKFFDHFDSLLEYLDRNRFRVIIGGD